MLMAYHWPGNVRELENVIERAMILSDDGVIHGYNLPPSLQTSAETGTSFGCGLEAKIEAVEYEMIVEALKTHNGNTTEAAKELGLTRRMLGLRMEKHHINYKDYRRGGAAQEMTWRNDANQFFICCSPTSPWPPRSRRRDRPHATPRRGPMSRARSATAGSRKTCDDVEAPRVAAGQCRRGVAAGRGRRRSSSGRPKNTACRSTGPGRRIAVHFTDKREAIIRYRTEFPLRASGRTRVAASLGSHDERKRRAQVTPALPFAMRKITSA